MASSVANVPKGFPHGSFCTNKSYWELKKKLQASLELDIISLLQNSKFCDVELIVDDESLFSHSCILKTRASRFYTFIFTEYRVTRTSLVSSVFLENVSVSYIRKFLENLYSESFLPECESFVLNYLILAKTPGKRPKLHSPDTETFCTPITSPSELRHSSLHSIETSATSRLVSHENIQSYYKIVSLEDSLEKELAEQDELFASLKFINKKRKTAKPNTLPLHSKSSSNSGKKKLPLWRPVVVKNEYHSVKSRSWQSKCDMDSTDKIPVRLKELDRNVSLGEDDLARLDAMEKSIKDCEVFLEMERRDSEKCLKQIDKCRKTELSMDAECNESKKHDVKSINTPPCSPMMTKEKVNNSNNFFIDASSLLDEDEVASLPPIKMNEVKVIDLSSDQERRQGELIFQNSIPHYSKHDFNSEVEEQVVPNFTEDLQFTIDITPQSGCNQFEEISQSTDYLQFEAESEADFPSYTTQEEPLQTSSLPVQQADPHFFMSLPPETIPRKISSESLPIVSGGVSPKDFSNPTSYSGSPRSRRAFETLPIVSGRADPQIEDKPVLQRKKPPQGESWVVDFGKPKVQRRISSESDECSKVQPPMPKAVENLKNESRKSDSDEEKIEKSASLGYFIDFGKETDVQKGRKHRNDSSNIKKNIFSIFIDLSDDSKSGESSLGGDEVTTDVPAGETKKPFYMFIGSDSPVGKRKLLPRKDATSEPTETTSNKKPSEDNNQLKKGSTFIIDETGVRSPKNEEGDSGVVATEESDDSFVRLADLDKSHRNPYMTDKVNCKSNKSASNRMVQSIPEGSWLMDGGSNKGSTGGMGASVMSASTGGRSVTKGFTVSKSLSRLFPNLSMSALSMVSKRNMIDPVSDSLISGVSSLTSSMEPAALEISTSETEVSCVGDGASRLGQDLLRMFLEEIGSDVVVEVAGRRIKAHKCILSSRCQYFAAMLSGGWVESAGNVISLQGFSYSAVHFALCHIYCGESELPDNLNIIELTTLADMLCLEGLKEVISFSLRVKYCHNFHAPCPGCCAGVLDCIPLAATYGLDDLYRKSLRWIAKYFVRVWPTKTFANLPKELLDKCLQYHIVHMTIENVLDTVLSIDKLRGSLPSIRWADTVTRLLNKLHDAAVKFSADHFSSILTSDHFLALGKNADWSIGRVRGTLIEATSRLPPEQACWSHARLHSLLSIAMSSEPPVGMVWNENFTELLRTLSECVQTSLIKQAPRAVRSKAWQQMEPELRNRIQEAASLILPQETNITGNNYARSSTSNIAKKSRDYSSLNSPALSARSTKASELRQFKLAISQQASRNGAQMRRQQQITEHRLQTDSRFYPVKPIVPTIRKMEVRKSQSTSEVPLRVNSGRFSEVKSRYLEPRSPLKTAPEKQQTKPTLMKRNPRGLSSSDSSRNCSPAMTRANNINNNNNSNAGNMLKNNRVNNSQTLRPESARASSTTSATKTQSQKGLSALTADDNMSTDSLATVSSFGDKDPIRKPSARGKENLNDKPKSAAGTKQPVRPASQLPRKTQSLSSFPNTTKTANQKAAINAPLSFNRRVATIRSQNLTPSKSNLVFTNRCNNNISKSNQKFDLNNKQQLPAIVSRSGTFLKDEPTILKKPQPTDQV